MTAGPTRPSPPGAPPARTRPGAPTLGARLPVNIIPSILLEAERRQRHCFFRAEPRTMMPSTPGVALTARDIPPEIREKSEGKRRRGVPDECCPRPGPGYGPMVWRDAAGDAVRRSTHSRAVALDGRGIPAGMSLYRRCDNPPCRSPAHLFIGAASDSQRDSSSTRRAPVISAPP